MTHHRGLIAASTADIEWDGQAIDLRSPSIRLDYPEQLKLLTTLPNDKSIRYVQGFQKGFLTSNSTPLIANVTTRMALLDTGSQLFPVSINDCHDAKNNSYVVSPLTAYCGYAKDELRRMGRPWIAIPMTCLINGGAGLLEWARLDKIVQINNWLLSTNLYPPGWQGDDLYALTHKLHAKFPDHALAYRSQNTYSNSELIKRFLEQGYLSIPSRQVYLFDGRNGENALFMAHHNCKIDTKLLEAGTFQIEQGDQLTAHDFSRIEMLYNLLYLDKYCTLNPQYSAEWMERGQRDGWLDFRVLRSKAGLIEGAVGWFSNPEILTAPIVGYNTALTQKYGLYRQLTQLCLQEAIKERKILNFSSGAAHFKRIRGGVARIEFSMVYVAHLPLYRRLVWRLLSFLLNTIGVSLMKKFKL
jgi:hypothetical protein